MLQSAASKQRFLGGVGRMDLQAAASDLTLTRVLTASTLCVDAEGSCATSSGVSVASEHTSEQCLEASSARPRFLHCLELAQVNWSRLAKNQEWRRVLKLLGLPSILCNKRTLQAFLEGHGLSKDVLKVSASSKDGARMGSAVLHAASGQSVAKVARFFHGRLLPGSRLPVSVQFATVQEEMQAKNVCLTEPLQVSFGSCYLEPPPGLEHMGPPPGLEGMVCRSMSTKGA
eukprot:TRINITY_DN4422_c0_g1_i1.p1 TRINITY_DN4422_c0_g1~~TRINITY_DN4422_c0_g1_i1.p1  ORF type:complete len:230 (+),score=44.32 TRINITY_DN4422_c0_g1_i1:57-746(+)